MPIRRKPDSDDLDEFPAAKLFLEDVRDIVAILTAPDSDEKSTEYTVRYRVRDLECDSIEELEKIGGKARRFEIEVSNRIRSSSLLIRPLATRLWLECPKSDVWVKRGKIKAIFDLNTIRWKELINDAFRLAVRVKFWILGVLALGALMLLMQKRTLGEVHWLGQVVFAGVMWLYIFVFIRPRSGASLFAHEELGKMVSGPRNTDHAGGSWRSS
jgi:hypothetical protein